jgi:hypothetical protein
MTDYMDKIDWTDAPDWAQWAAMDQRGRVWAFDAKPEATTIGWTWGGREVGRLLSTAPISNWRESLRQRPVAKPERPASDYDWDARDEAPKQWRDMTPEEKGALLLAHHEGKVIESRWLGENWTPTCAPEWHLGASYRIRPEPKRETVGLKYSRAKDDVAVFWPDSAKEWDLPDIELPLADGKVVPGTYTHPDGHTITVGRIE